MENQNNVTEFVLLGLLMNKEMRKICFAFFLLCFFTFFLGNFIIFITITCSHLIQQPMYYFLCHLALTDLAYTSTTIPTLIRELATEIKTISYTCFMTQIFAAHLLAGVEMFILASMAFDRYIAICKPLHYRVTVNQHRCNMLVLTAWAVAFWHSIDHLLMILWLPFCGPNQIDYYICDVKSLLKLVCTDSHVISIIVIANNGMVCLVTFLVLLASYIVIFYNLPMHSGEGRHKALSTCGSYLIIVILFFLPCVYNVPPLSDNSSKKEFSVLYTVIAPMLNILIYTLKNTEMKNIMQKLWYHKM